MVIGYYCPTFSLAQSINELITNEMDALSFAGLVAELAELDTLSEALSIASEVVGISQSSVSAGDYRVVVRANYSMTGHYIYSPDGKLKLVKIYD